jgi:ABC-type dipeptide/oligopeptide/nickel transport system permease subunit
MFIIIICFLITVCASNFVFIRKSPLKFDSLQGNKAEEFENSNSFISKNDLTRFKKYMLNKLKSPISIVGVSIFLFLTIISIFPKLITPYTLADITFPSYGEESYALPSLEHPLGTAHYGFDLLALVIWGIRDLLASGGWTVIIGLIGGIPFGFIASKFKRSDKQIIQIVMSLFFIFPSILITVFMVNVSRGDPSVQVFIIGILLIPLFTNRIAYIEPKFTSILKELATYIPFALVFSSLMYTLTGFLGFTDIKTVQLGYIIHRAQEWHILERIHAIFWPGLSIFVFNIGLIFIYQGLNSRNGKSQQKVIFDTLKLKYGGD